ncbi:MAG: response regulator [Spirulinaceae cyanobacterium]
MLNSNKSENKADILVVDDTPNNVRLLSKVLTDRGYTVRKALNGDRAIQSALTQAPDLILLDINMPDMDGYQVCEILKSKPETAAVPIIFISALDETIDKVKAFQIGGTDYITKPFEVEEILIRVKNQLTIRKMTQQLSQQVQQRTDDLKEAHIKLIQQEKMSELGLMVAGIAHEINNPLGFIISNIDHANDYIQDMFELIELYQQKQPQPDADIRAKIDAIDLEFIYDDLPQIINSMKEGTRRIRTLSHSLRTFARPDEAEMTNFDLRESLDSTLTILKHRLKANTFRSEITIEKDYDSLSTLQCYPSQLNQVFMNLIANAIDAIDEVQPHSDPKIEIRTTCDRAQERIKIEIQDNGNGMSEDIQARLFNHLFTTKPIGKGTGLGLSIVQQIVETNHQGKINFKSAIGHGTSFIIELPLMSH